MTKDEQATNVATILIFLNQVFLFFFNIKKSIKRLNNNATIIIISLKKTNKSKSTLTGDFLFKKKDKKELTENSEERPEVVNKEALA